MFGCVTRVRCCLMPTPHINLVLLSNARSVAALDLRTWTDEQQQAHLGLQRDLALFTTLTVSRGVEMEYPD